MPIKTNINETTIPQRACDSVREYVDTILSERKGRLKRMLENAKSNLKDEEYIDQLEDGFGNPIFRDMMSECGDFIVGTFAMIEGQLINICTSVAREEYEQGRKNSKNWYHHNSRKILEIKFNVIFDQVIIDKLWDSTPLKSSEADIRNKLAHNNGFLEKERDYVWSTLAKRGFNNDLSYFEYCNYILGLADQHLTDVMNKIDAANTTDSHL